MNIYLSAVNQNLFFASLLRGQIAAAGENRHLETALVQSVVYQLIQAYRHHLREIAASYQCPDPDAIADSGQLARALMDRDKWPAEAQEIKRLEEDDASWLGQLLNAWRGFDRAQERSAATEREGIIPVRQEGEDQAPLNSAQVGQWLAGMQELVERHRNLMFEC